MADLSMTADRSPENRAVLPSGTAETNVVHLLEIFLRKEHYQPIREQRAHLTYARVHKYSHFAVYDLLVFSIVDSLEDAEGQVLALEAECEAIRRLILEGWQFPLLEVWKHPFLRLRKAYTRQTYKVGHLPVGFQIRPIILLREGGTWDYLAGRTARIDVLSFDTHTLDFFMQQHYEQLQNQKSSLLNWRKYAYWKAAGYLLDYGHYPLIAVWVLDFICALLQLPFPLPLGGMIALTAVLYSGFIGIAYGLYKLFLHSQRSELHATVSPPMAVQTTPDAEVVIAEDSSEENPLDRPPTGEGALPEAEMNPEEEITLVEGTSFEDENPATEPLSTIKQVPPLIEGRDTKTRMDAYYMPAIHKAIRLLLPLHISEAVSKQGEFLFRKVFSWLLGHMQRNIPRDLPLSDLLKILREQTPIKKWIKHLLLWVSKIGTATPFEPGEISAFKKFLLLFLQDLALLPPELQAVVEQHYLLERFTPPPVHNVRATLIQLEDQVADLKRVIHIKEPSAEAVSDHKSYAVPEPMDLEVAPKSTANLDVASLSQTIYTEIPEIDRVLFLKICESDRNGLYCILIVDKADSEAYDVIGRFEECTKDLDIANRDWMDVQKFGESLLRQIIGEVTPPVVVVGCGSHRQVVPYDQETDDTRLYSVITGFQAPANRITFREKPEEVPPEEEDAIPLTKELPMANPSESPPPPKGQVVEGEPLIDELPNQMPVLEERLPMAEDNTTEESLKQLGTRISVPDEPSHEPLHLQIPVETLRKKDALIGIPPDANPLDSALDSENFPEDRASQVQIPIAEVTNSTESAVYAGNLKKRIGDKAAFRANLQNLQPGSILIDGSNIAYLIRDQQEDRSIPRIECVLQLIDHLKMKWSIPEDKLVVYLDAKTETLLKNTVPEQLKLVKNQRLFRSVSKRHEADTAFINIGEECHKRFLIISNDAFEKKPTWFRIHRIGVALDPKDRPFLLITSMRELLETYFQGNKALLGGETDDA